MEVAGHACAGETLTFFDGFTLTRIAVADAVELRVRIGGAGPPVVLLHGHPRTHTTWYEIAPRLVRAGYTVVCPDLRGYGRSSKLPTTPDHSPYSKRAMARDILALMTALGHQEFLVVGHDRGSYVAQRLALDHPSVVTAVALLDCVPIGEALGRADARFATAWWHWFFFAQPDKPERAILADPLAWYGGTPERMGRENYADFTTAISDPATVRAMLEDYRAGLGVDRRADDDDRASGRMITCPTLVLWSTRDDLEDLYGDVLEVWRPWASALTGGPIDSGHHMAEDAPAELAERLISFFSASVTDTNVRSQFVMPPAAVRRSCSETIVAAALRLAARPRVPRPTSRPPAPCVTQVPQPCGSHHCSAPRRCRCTRRLCGAFAAASDGSAAPSPGRH